MTDPAIALVLSGGVGMVCLLIILAAGRLTHRQWDHGPRIHSWHHLGRLSTDQLLAREAAIMERQRLGDDSQWRELIAIADEKRQRGL